MEDAAMKSRRIVLLTLVGVLVTALLAACSGGTVGGTKAPASGSSGGKTYNVTATEFQFAPNKFDAKVGQTITFKVTNKGTVEHTLAVMSPDGSQELAKLSAQPGETKSLDFTPNAAGTYPIQCDIAGHKEAGMTGQLTVQ
jgi:plastocyanin